MAGVVQERIHRPLPNVLRRVFRAFQYRDFRLMWIGACTSSIGTWMQVVAQGWLVYELSHSARILSLDQFLATVPILLFSLFGGVLADRIDRRYVLSGSQYVQMTCALVLTGLVAFGVVRVWHVLCLSFITGFGRAFGGPAYQALIPMLVDKEDVQNAIALNSIQYNVAVMIGPALGGVALANLGEAWCFGLNSVSFIAPIVALALLRARFLPEKTSETILCSMRSGIRFVHKHGAMGALMVLAFCMTFLSMPVRTFFPVFASDVFHRGASTYAMFYSLMGVGSILGSIAMAAAGNIAKKGRLALIMLLCLGAGICIFAASTNIWISYAMLVLAGTSMISVFTLVNSLVQLITTNEMRGRVMSVYNVAFQGGMPLGNLAAGWLVPIFSAPLVVGTNGVLLVFLALFFLLIHRRVAQL